MAYNPSKVIAKQIVLAQIASNSGKDDYSLSCHKDGIAKICGYSVKEDYIAKAITLINSTPFIGWSYYVEAKDDQNGYPSYIVYFEYTGIKGQCSFHTPLKRSTHVFALNGKGRHLEWDGVRGGSEDFCQKLIKKFNL